MKASVVLTSYTGVSSGKEGGGYLTGDRTGTGKTTFSKWEKKSSATSGVG